MTQAPLAAAGPARLQRGLTLVELLVSMTIGLVLMLAIVAAYLGSVNASSVATAQGRMNEDAQAGLLVLSQHIRMAGYNPKQPQYAATGPYVPPAGVADTSRNPVFDTNNWPIRGCDGTFTNITTATNTSALACTTTTGTDSLAVRYEVDPYNTVKNSTNQPTDCLGQALTASSSSVNAWNTATTSVVAKSVTYTVSESRFYIATPSGTTSPNLYCKGNGGSAQPLVENVEDLRITYGVAPSTATTTLTVAGYLTASGLEALVPGTFADSNTAWSKVATVRVCLIVRSEQPVATSTDSAQYYDCDGNLVTTPPDLRLRRAYSTTIVLRNRVAT